MENIKTNTICATATATLPHDPSPLQLYHIFICDRLNEFDAKINKMDPSYLFIYKIQQTDGTSPKFCTCCF